MKKYVLVSLFCLSGIGAFSCSSTHENVSEHHHHPEAQFAGKCAYSVMNKKYSIEGKKEYSLEHHGITYYFSTSESRDLFKEHIDENIIKASSAWRERK